MQETISIKIPESNDNENIELVINELEDAMKNENIDTVVIYKDYYETASQLDKNYNEGMMLLVFLIMIIFIGGLFVAMLTPTDYGGYE